ncbi:hypothetical protein [uncultured Arcobacter sp.]|uniref:hypothetical protein n=1 Tax=uncultured Arcobacter sp. TaxID=165434 RepID=UPI002606B9CC|nr:hypothetical protein [uncultured Arcobacter sp.]
MKVNYKGRDQKRGKIKPRDIAKRQKKAMQKALGFPEFEIDSFAFEKSFVR